MANEVAIELLNLFSRKVHEAVKEAIEVLSAEPRAPGEDPDIASVTSLPPGDHRDARWLETTREDDVSQRWPDATVDTYNPFIVYRCGGGPFAGAKLALGWVNTPGKEGEVVGFILGSGGGSKRPLTVFFPAGDFASSGERLSMIRGKDGTRKGFGPHEQLPAAYDTFTIGVLGDRIPGKWNVKAIVVTNDDFGMQGMLNHTAIQARMRGLI
jgi:hypothetical protein